MNAQVPQERKTGWPTKIGYALLIGIGCILFFICIVIAVISASSGGPS